MTSPPSPGTFDTFKSLLDRALAEDFGLFIELENPRSFEQQICKIKAIYPQYAGLMVCWPSLENTVFLMKKSAELT